MKTNIALIGFMGTGKTAVGQLLARKTRLTFIEMDSLIASKAGKPISQIFEDDGEVQFRELEIEVAKRVSMEQNAVIACGGGVVLNWINIERLRQNSVIVLLTASPAETLKRVSKEVGQRPLLKGVEQMARIRELLKSRQPFYSRAADLAINTSRHGVESVANEIIARLREDENFDWPE